MEKAHTITLIKLVDCNAMSKSFIMLTGSVNDTKTAPNPGIVPVRGLKMSLAVPSRFQFLSCKPVA